MKEQFNKLVTFLENATQDESYSIENFPEISKTALEQFEWDYDEDEMLEFLLESFKVPKQVDPTNRFGEPLFTLYNNDKFSIDMIFWQNVAPGIHSHAFRGAFKVLKGTSLHLVYEYKLNEFLNFSVASGEIDLSYFEIVKKEGIRKIEVEDKLIHRVIHLEKPSVTFRIRTLDESELKQYSYYRSGTRRTFLLGSDETVIGLLKKIAYIEFLYESDKKIFSKAVVKFCSELTEDDVVGIMDGLMGNVIGKEYHFRNALLDEIRNVYLGRDWFEEYSSGIVSELENGPLPYSELAGEDRLVCYLIDLGFSVDQINPVLKAYNDKTLTKIYMKNFIVRVFQTPYFYEKEYEEIQDQLVTFINGGKCAENFEDDFRVALLMKYLADSA